MDAEKQRKTIRDRNSVVKIPTFDFNRLKCGKEGNLCGNDEPCWRAFLKPDFKKKIQKRPSGCDQKTRRKTLRPPTIDCCIERSKPQIINIPISWDSSDENKPVRSRGKNRNSKCCNEDSDTSENDCASKHIRIPVYSDKGTDVYHIEVKSCASEICRSKPNRREKCCGKNNVCDLGVQTSCRSSKDSGKRQPKEIIIKPDFCPGPCIKVECECCRQMQDDCASSGQESCDQLNDCCTCRCSSPCCPKIFIDAEYCNDCTCGEGTKKKRNCCNRENVVDCYPKEKKHLCSTIKKSCECCKERNDCGCKEIKVSCPCKKKAVSCCCEEQRRECGCKEKGVSRCGKKSEECSCKSEGKLDYCRSEENNKKGLIIETRHCRANDGNDCCCCGEKNKKEDKLIVPVAPCCCGGKSKGSSTNSGADMCCLSVSYCPTKKDSTNCNRHTCHEDTCPITDDCCSNKKCLAKADGCKPSRSNCQLDCTSRCAVYPLANENKSSGRKTSESRKRSATPKLCSSRDNNDYVPKFKKESFTIKVDDCSPEDDVILKKRLYERERHPKSCQCEKCYAGKGSLQSKVYCLQHCCDAEGYHHSSPKQRLCDEPTEEHCCDDDDDEDDDEDDEVEKRGFEPELQCTFSEYHQSKTRQTCYQIRDCCRTPNCQHCPSTSMSGEIHSRSESNCVPVEIEHYPCLKRTNLRMCSINNDPGSTDSDSVELIDIHLCQTNCREDNNNAVCHSMNGHCAPNNTGECGDLDLCCMNQCSCLIPNNHYHNSEACPHDMPSRRNVSPETCYTSCQYNPYTADPYYCKLDLSKCQGSCFH